MGVHHHDQPEAQPPHHAQVLLQDRAVGLLGEVTAGHGVVRHIHADHIEIFVLKAHALKGLGVSGALRSTEQRGEHHAADALRRRPGDGLRIQRIGAEGHVGTVPLQRAQRQIGHGERCARLQEFLRPHSFKLYGSHQDYLHRKQWTEKQSGANSRLSFRIEGIRA